MENKSYLGEDARGKRVWLEEHLRGRNFGLQAKRKEEIEASEEADEKIAFQQEESSLAEQNIVDELEDVAVVVKLVAVEVDRD